MSCSTPAGSVIRFASMGDDQDADLVCAIVDTIDHAPIAHSIAQPAREFSAQTLDVVVPARVVLQLRETAGQLAGERRISGGEEGLRLRRENDIKHRGAPCAS